MKMRILKQVKKVNRSTIQIHSKTQYTDIYRDMYRDNVKNVKMFSQRRLILYNTNVPFTFHLHLCMLHILSKLL